MGGLIALCCWISINYTRRPGGFSTLCIASGLLTGILLTSPRQRWVMWFTSPTLGIVIFATLTVVTRSLAGRPRHRKHNDIRNCMCALVALYTAWDRAESGKGYAAKAAGWKNKQDALEAPHPTPASS